MDTRTSRQHAGSGRDRCTHSSRSMRAPHRAAGLATINPPATSRLCHHRAESRGAMAASTARQCARAGPTRPRASESLDLCKCGCSCRGLERRSLECLEVKVACVQLRVPARAAKHVATPALNAREAHLLAALPAPIPFLLHLLGRLSRAGVSSLCGCIADCWCVCGGGCRGGGCRGRGGGGGRGWGGSRGWQCGRGRLQGCSACS